jgi:hypothetical protein
MTGLRSSLDAFVEPLPVSALWREQAFALRTTRDHSHRLNLPTALRTPLEHGELGSCASLRSCSAALAHELDEHAHRPTLSRPHD